MLGQGTSAVGGIDGRASAGTSTGHAAHCREEGKAVSRMRQQPCAVRAPPVVACLCLGYELVMQPTK